MIKGIPFALSACLIWGLIFIVPQFLDGFSSIEISLGCYFLYGILSVFFLIKEKVRLKVKFPKSIWFKALYFSLVSTIVYCTCVVLATRYSTPAMSALILGISPVSIAFYGNIKRKERSFRSLILPSILIVVGLIVINAPNFSSHASPSEYGLGLVCSFLALISWSWYVVANSRFLKDHPHISSGHWSTLIGVATLFWVILCSTILGVFFHEQMELHKYYNWNDALISFLIGSVVLGLLYSWFGTFLWNKASLRLPISLTAQLTIFETIFGLMYVYALEQRVPPKYECIGISLLLGAVAYSMYLSYKTTKHPKPSYSVQFNKNNNDLGDSSEGLAPT